jgi:hypothetical protein
MPVFDARAPAICTAALLVLVSCGQGEPVFSKCDEITKDNYKGLAIALDNGTAMFSTSERCSFLLTGDLEYEEHVKKAWSNSSIHEPIRPIFVDVQGVVKEAKKPNRKPYFVVQKVFTVEGGDDSPAARTQLYRAFQRTSWSRDSSVKEPPDEGRNSVP